MSGVRFLPFTPLLSATRLTTFRKLQLRLVSAVVSKPTRERILSRTPRPSVPIASKQLFRPQMYRGTWRLLLAIRSGGADRAKPV